MLDITLTSLNTLNSFKETEFNRDDLDELVEYIMR